LGAHAILIGVVGDDASAEDLQAQLALAPTIDTRLVVDPSRPTTVKTRFVADRQQIMRADLERRTPMSDTTAARVLTTYLEALTDVDVVVLSDYAKGLLSEALTQAAIAAARQAGKRIIVDPKSRSFVRYAGATVLTPNRHELELACGHGCVTDEQLVSGARQFLEQGLCDTMVVTRGAQGMSVIPGNAPATHLPATAREVFDVSGAGDTAVAALSLGLAGGGDIIAAANLANVAAALVVAKLGTAVVTAGEIVAGVTQFDSRADRGRLFTLDHVTGLARNWRAQGFRVAFTNGCFDLLHAGHLSLLEQARRSADRLIVGLNSDLSVRRLKGVGRPVQSEVTRATLVASLKTVDAVVIFSEDTPLSLIQSLEPDVLVKGADYSAENVVGADIVIRRGGKVLLAELVAGQSTTSTLQKVAAASIF
jgi:D-beta-D-heptose 7-phosphate kinase/D-beta-D-heptose 1-phosphate adenosyltransferase